MEMKNDKPMSVYDRKFKVLLGYTKPKQYGERRPVFLEGFKWDCNWYWGGGYIGNRDFHAHFNGAFLDVPDIRGHVLGNFVTPWQELREYQKENKVVLRNGAAVWEDIGVFLDDVPPHIAANWWRIKDLYKQFYKLQNAAEVFQYGGHCTSEGRTEAEINKELARSINLHIAQVIIPEIAKALGVES